MHYASVTHLRPAQVPIDWKAAVIQGVRPCVAKMADNGTITLQPFSASLAGCDLTNYNYLVIPRFAPRSTPFRDPNVRIDAQPQFDMSLGKTVHIHERMNAQFRVEAFNVFNRFWMPLEQFNNNPDSAQFGQIIKGSAAQGIRISRDRFSSRSSSFSSGREIRRSGRAAQCDRRRS